MKWLSLATGLVMLALGAVHAYRNEILDAVLYALAGLLFLVQYASEIIENNR